eukprot:Skav224851  [mRNA]  locus=scaffold322:61912:66018:+ [translate_table: standard]
MVRILRLAKISRMSEAVQEQIQSQAANIHYSLFKSIFRLLLLTHLLACAWYGIGRLSGEEWGDHSWVKEIGLTERTLGYQYTTCYHWAFCQMGVGGVAIYPTNTYERSFGICAAFLALMTFSTLVSKMTSLMSSLNKLKDEETEQFRTLDSSVVTSFTMTFLFTSVRGLSAFSSMGILAALSSTSMGFGAPKISYGTIHFDDKSDDILWNPMEFQIFSLDTKNGYNTEVGTLMKPTSPNGASFSRYGHSCLGLHLVVKEPTIDGGFPTLGPGFLAKQG